MTDYITHLYQSHSNVELLSTLILNVYCERYTLSDGEAPAWNSDVNRHRT